MTRKRFGKRGSALILTLFLLIVLEFLGLAFLTRVQGEMAQTTRDVTSYYVLRTALADTREWCRNRQQVELLDTAIAGLPSGVDPEAPATMNTYYERTSSGSTVPPPPGWSWRVRLYPDRFTAGNSAQQGSNPIRCYRIVVDAIDSHSHQNATVYRRAEAWLQQEPLNPGWRYNQSPSLLWLNLGNFHIKGPFETNAQLRLSIPWSSSAWDDLQPNSANAPFQNTASFGTATSGTPDQIQYNGSNVPYNSSELPEPLPSHPGKNRYDRMAKLGRAAFQIKPTFTMPEVSEFLAEAAWGSETLPSPIATGLNVQPGTHAENRTAGGTSVSIPKAVNGILVGGPNIEAIYMQVGNDATNGIDVASLRGASNDNYSIKIRQAGVVRRITEIYSDTTINPGGSWTLNGVSVNGPLVLPGPPPTTPGQEIPSYVVIQNNSTVNSYIVMKGSGNGLLYSLPDIRGIEGQNKGRHTFAVDQMNNREIHITGPITRADVTPGAEVPASTTRDQVGLVGYAVRMAAVRTPHTGGPAISINRSVWNVPNDPLFIYACIFAGRPNDPWASNDRRGGGMGTIDHDNSGWNDLGWGTGVGAGRFRLYGSLTENIRQAKGTFNPSTGASTSGMNYQFYYDNNLQAIQPPYFPAKSTFLVTGWSDRVVRENAN